jgi:D-amino peptidase
MRKLLISADLEGSAGVASQHALAPDRWEWAAARQWMTAEVVAAAEAAFAAGYDEILVADSHGNAHNVDPDKLPDNVRLIRSWPRPLLQMQGIEDPAVEGCFFVGYHDGSVAEGGLLAHSYHGGVYRNLKLNGVDCSEGYLNAALAGEFGKPVMFICGDAQTVADSRRYAPQAETLETKSAIGWRASSSLPPKQVCRLISDAATRALAKKAAPFIVEGPYELELEFTTQLTAEMMSYLPSVQRRGAYSIASSFARIEQAMRFVSFAMLYSPTGVIAL